MSRAIVQSQKLASIFRVETVPIRFSDAISDIGTINARKILRLISIACHLFKKCVSDRPDIVYVTLTPTGKAFFRDLLFVAIIRLMRLPRIFHLHGKGIRKETRHPLMKRLYSWAFKGAQIILLYPGHYWDIQEVHKPEDCYVLPNGIEDSFENQAPDGRTRIREGPVRILFFSNMGRSKGPLELVKALSILKNGGLVFRAFFAGEWSSEAFRQTFHSLVRKYGLEDRVTYLGPKYGKDKWKLFKSAEIFVFPTFNEAFGLVILEAMSCRLPVIATMDGAIPDIVVEGETGFLVPKRDVEAMAKRLALLILDGELRVKLGCAGRKRFEENFTMKIFENNLVNVFNQCLISTKPERFH